MFVIMNISVIVIMIIVTMIVIVIMLMITVEVLRKLYAARCLMAVGEEDVELLRIRQLGTALAKFDVRHALAIELDKALPPADATGRRLLQAGPLSRVA